MEIRIPESELIINPDNSIYHLHSKPKDIQKNVILVGDPGRVSVVSSFFDKITRKIENREFIIHTGEFNQQPITVVGTGIGTDNIDIVLNEIDACVNIDFQTRKVKDELTTLNLIRIGTCGGLQPEIFGGDFVASKQAIGFDNLLHYYNLQQTTEELKIQKALCEHLENQVKVEPYVVSSSEELFTSIVDENVKFGITATAPGFYAPQGRMLRASLKDELYNSKIQSFNYHSNKVTNFEMETSALYGLGKILGHNCLTVCVVIANRVNQSFASDYKASVKTLIEHVLVRLTN